MSRLEPLDKLLLGTLVPIFVLCFGLHVREVVRTGLQQPPVFAVPSFDGERYPTVGGLRLERDTRWNDLQVGDQLIQVGDVDLAGTGYIGFDALVLQQAGAGDRVPLSIRRDGQRREIELVMNRHERGWFRIPILLCLAFVGSLALARAPSRATRAMFGAFIAMAIVQAPFFGPSLIQSYAYAILFNLGVPVALALLIRWATLFPEEMPEDQRLSPHWAWFALLSSAVRVSYFLGGPIPSDVVAFSVLFSDVCAGALILGIASWNYAHADPVGRRRMRWPMYGAYLGIVPVLAGLLVSLVPGFEWLSFDRTFEITAILPVLVPLGMLVAIVRHNLFDIDRLISATAAYSAAAAVLLAAVIAIGPAIAASLSSISPVSTGALQLVVAIALAAVLVPVSRKLRPHVDRLFFAERLAREQGIERLLEDLAGCRADDEVMQRVRDRLAAIFRPTVCHLLVRTTDGFALEGRTLLSPRTDLVLALEANPAAMEIGDERRASIDRLPDAEQRALASLGVCLLITLRRGSELVAIVALGPRVSGEIYDRTDLTLLRAVSESGSAALHRLAEARVLREERERASQLARQKEEAENVNAARSRFLAAASHDLRQPLHALGLFAASLSEREIDGDTRVTVERIQDSTRALGEMFDALLDVSRLDVGALEPRVTDFALAPLLERLEAEFRERAAEAGLSLLVERPDVWVKSDVVLLGRVIQNLLSNAIRYTDHGEITLRCLAKGDALEIRVSDTGPGIPTAQQEEIFREFVRGDPLGPKEGLGLGLSIVERIARLLEHPLGLTSAPGQGSTFSITVPVAEPGRMVVAPSRTDFDGRRILVVDDDLAVLSGTGQLLREWGAHVVLASSLDDALESLESLDAPIDVMLADFRLRGDETGIDVVEGVREACKREVPAGIVTGETGPDVLDAIRDAGLRQVGKPLPPFKLRALLIELLR